MPSEKVPYWQQLQDPRWQKKRLEILERDQWTCRDCKATDKTLHIHHCLYEKGSPWDTDEIFLLTLCNDCHERRQHIETAGRRALGLFFATQDSDSLAHLVNSMVHTLENDNHFPKLLGIDQGGQIYIDGWDANTGGGEWGEMHREVA
jgi:hypothetical protein